MDDSLRQLLDEREIVRVLHRYCRGIDRRQLNLVRLCYHPDATDDHGDYRGGVDGFIDFLGPALARWESTMHFLGNLDVEVSGDTARAETYAVAYHRIAARADKPARDMVAGIRYVDDFERRAGEWKIFTRICVLDWWRTDPVAEGGWIAPPSYTRGRTDGSDPVFLPRLPRP